MDDLERQLRDLADHRAAQVAPATLPATEMRRHVPRRWLAVAAIVAVGVVAGAGYLATRDGDTPVTTDAPPATIVPPIASDTVTHTSERWGLTFELPAGWVRVGPEADRWTGPDGALIELTAHGGGGTTVVAVASKVAAVERSRYDREATIEEAIVDGNPALVVRPHTAEPELVDVGSIVVDLPVPRGVMTTLVATIDLDHLDAILPTLRWEDTDLPGNDGDGGELTPDLSQVFTSERWGLSFGAPAGWEPSGLQDDAWGAPDGSLVLVGYSDQRTIGEIAESLADVERQRFDGDPSVSETVVDGTPALVVEPITLGPDGYLGASVVTPLPAPRNGSTTLVASIDLDHLDAILPTLRWEDTDLPGYDGDGGELTPYVPCLPGSDILAIVDLDGDGTDEVIVASPENSNTAWNAHVVTDDGCGEEVPDTSGDPALVLYGASGNSCGPTGCVVRVDCAFHDRGADLVATSLAPTPRATEIGPELEIRWTRTVLRLADGVLETVDDRTSVHRYAEFGDDAFATASGEVGCRSVVDDAEYEIVDAFSAWAGNPDGPPPLNLADGVGLGLIPNLVTTVAASALADPATWVLDIDQYNAYAGPFDLLEPLRRPGEVAVTGGPHWHCASPPWPEPPQLFGLRRISIQPATATSCLEWFALDLFLDDAGVVHGITLELYEP